MNVETAKRQEPRFKQSYCKELNIKQWGVDNAYPQRMFAHISSSATGAACLSRLISFLEGDGVTNVSIGEAIVNKHGDTWDDIVHAVANDYGTYGGFALHIRYNAAAEIAEITPLSFAACRLEETTKNGDTFRIAVHPDWTEQDTRGGEQLQVNKDTVERYPVFNPSADVVRSQIIRAGGVEEYGGQVLWVSNAGGMNYPTPVYDAAVTDICVDEGVSNVLYRNVKNNFLPAGAFVHKKGETVQGNDDDGLSEQLDTFTGDTNAAALIDVTIERDEDKPEFIQMRGANFDKEFTGSDAISATKIYTAFKQEPWLCIRQGKVGFGGDVMRDAYNIYNRETKNARRLIERNLTRIFNRWTLKQYYDGDGYIEIKTLSV